jgi:hypothetical protein
MTTVAKNGYSYTGYTEGFICPEGTTIAQGAVLNPLPNPFGIVGAVDINYTEFRNAGLFVRSAETASAVASFTSKHIITDGQTRMDTGHGVFILDIDGTFCEISDVTYSTATGLYTYTITGAPDVVQGKSYKVVARICDTGGATASKAYAAGDHVTEIYP